jgi:hypothetical protein
MCSEIPRPRFQTLPEVGVFHRLEDHVEVSWLCVARNMRYYFDALWPGAFMHVAVVEGTIGRVQTTRGGPIVPHWGKFHSCLVIADKIFTTPGKKDMRVPEM